MEEGSKVIDMLVRTKEVEEGRHPDSGFSDSSTSSSTTEEEVEAQTKSSKAEEVERRGRVGVVRSEGEVGGLGVAFYSVSDMIAAGSLQLDINSNLLTGECLSTSFMGEEGGRGAVVGRSNPVPGHLGGRGQAGGPPGDLDGMDCPLGASRHRGVGGGGSLAAWLAEVRGLQEAECSIMLQSKPLRLGPGRRAGGVGERVRHIQERAHQVSSEFARLCR